ncbi:uncharacterized protein LOC111079080 [Drosophila obscura]|uniref:uncharacterized protein LOC111079080 n=1 Tax=Drosophila obscura TaxID=7282 RepID=UPI001BB2BA0A|nr:uncharacterized protein LOC111079080 [Drosophila obscura]
MEAEEGKELVIKMAQKNKETQTMKAGHSNWFAQVAAFPAVGPRYTGNPLAPIQAFVPRQPSSSCTFYMNREQELYRRACRLKGIRLGCLQLRDDYSVEPSDEKLPKGSYRYTLEEMKSLNPYRLVDIED